MSNRLSIWWRDLSKLETDGGSTMDWFAAATSRRMVLVIVSCFGMIGRMVATLKDLFPRLYICLCRKKAL